jgi:hypothetical protein
MTVKTLGGALNDYIGGLGGPRTDPGGNREFKVNIDAPPEAKDKVVAHLVGFVRAVVSSTNARFGGWTSVAGDAGCRDGAFAIPGRGDGRARSGDAFVRPPFVDRLVQLGVSSMSEAHTIADVFRAKFELEESVATTAGEGAQSRTRRWLQVFQLGQLGCLGFLTWWAFVSVAGKLNAWPSSSVGLTGTGGGAPTATSATSLKVACALIVALGITVGFYRAARERSISAQADPDGEPIRGLMSADRDPVVSKAWVLGLALSTAIAGLIGIGGYFTLDSVDLGRMVPGVLAWMVWGAVAYFASGLMAQLSQHWLNVHPVEVYLTSWYRSSTDQNAASAEVGRRYIDDVLHSQHSFVVEASLALIEHYYEMNLLMRNSSRTRELDQFIGDDIKAAHREMLATASRLSGKAPMAK